MSNAVKKAYLEEEIADPSHKHLLEWFYARTCKKEREGTQQNG